jgi:hydroxyethylthiazole kinase-like uncharacterized protein yjeF
MGLPRPDADGDKEGRGRVIVVAGSREVPGGALLAGIGALRAGAGKLQIATCESVAIPLGLAVPEALVAGLPETAEGGIAPEAADILVPRVGRCHAVLIGPGMADPEAASALTAALLGVDGPTFVLDAAALEGLAAHPELVRRHRGRVVITPHSGEMASLLGIPREQVVADPCGAAGQAARHLGAMVVLKGSCTWIVSPAGECWSYDEGRVGLATSGSGDTLAGIVAGLLARGAEPAMAAAWGVFLHGEAGNRLTRRLGPLGFLARELLAEVPSIMAELEG